MTIFVGSTNPIKTNAVINAAIEAWPEVEVIGFKTQSGIGEQPLSDEETRQGARNRSRSAFRQGLEQKPGIKPSEMLAVGLEGGVFFDKDNVMWSTVWIVVTDASGQFWESNGARFQVPMVVAELIKNGGEMGPVVEQLTGHQNVKQGTGMIGIITENFVDRTEEYTGIAKMALGLWYGRNWQEQLNR